MSGSRGKMIAMRTPVLRRAMCTTSTSTLTTPALPAGKTWEYIPPKMKEEILGLYESDGERWTAVTLSVRFGVPRDNVAGLLKLHRVRQERLAKVAELDSESRTKIETLRAKSIDAWMALPVPFPAGAFNRRRLKDAVNVTAPSEIEKQKQKQELAEIEQQEQEREQKENEEEEKLKVASKKSEWAEYIEKHYDQVQDDVSRKTSFAFIEVGGTGKFNDNNSDDDKLYRAVWIRDGRTGKIRLADNDERLLLKDKVRYRDSKAFLSQ